MTGTRKNILYVENCQDIGGAERSTLLLLDHLDRQRYTPFLVVPAQGPLTQEIAARGIEFAVVPKLFPELRTLPALVLALAKFLFFVKRCRIDLVHVNDPDAYLVAGLALRFLRLPTVCHVRFPFSAEVIGYLARRTAHPGLFIFNSQYMQGALEQLVAAQMPGARHAVVHNAVDTGAFRPDGSHRDYLVQNFGLPAGAPVVSIVANFTEAKDLETFLRAAQLVHRELPQARFLVVGGEIGAARGKAAALKELARELGVGDAVLFTGHQRAVHPLLNCTDVAVCTSKIESFGRCVIEAMSCQCPVVASRVGGIPEIVSSEELGILVPPGDVEGFARAILGLLRDPAERTAMGARARTHVLRHFAVAPHVDKIQQVYRQLLNAPTRQLP